MTPQRRPSKRRTGPPLETPATWISARARNALRRPLFIGLVSLLTFAVALIALVVVPQQARKAAAGLKPAAASRPDTESTVAAMTEADRQVVSAESSLAKVRVQLTQLIAATAAANARDTSANGNLISSEVRGRRDSLNAQVTVLGNLIARSENAPLLGSYRALAQSAPLQSDVRVKAMLDSLVEIERERDSYSAVGGVDPAFVALTARANELGREIAALAATRRSVLRAELAALAPPAPTITSALAAQPLPDTLSAARARDAARDAAAGVATRLTRERTELAQLDAREERANEISSVSASPSAVLAAALVFGAMLGFGVALYDEVRRPRIADAFEAERTTGVRVIGIVKPMPALPERRRRATDVTAPPYMDSGADGHQLIYLTVASAGANTVMLTITGDNPQVAAIVAVNFAAIAADEARAALIIDTDSDASSVSDMLTISTTTGVATLADRRGEWSEVTRAEKVGRDRMIDIVPSGPAGATLDNLKSLLARDATRLSRRYDAIVLVSSQEQVLEGLPAALPITDVIYCARAGSTAIADLKLAMEEIVKAGANPLGIVLWNAPNPILKASSERVEELSRSTSRQAAQVAV